MKAATGQTTETSVTDESLYAVSKSQFSLRKCYWHWCFASYRLAQPM